MIRDSRLLYPLPGDSFGEGSALMGFRPLLVLFVSTGNAARSLIAETLLNAKNSGAYRARSAGVAPLEFMHPETKNLLERAGYETAKLHPKPVEDFLKAAEYVKVDIIVTLSEEARVECPMVWPGDPVRAHWAVDNPLGAERPDIREWKFRKCLATLEARISTLIRMRPDLSPSEMLLNLRAIGMVV